MSKYTEDKHGVVIGWNNSWYDGGNPERSWNAILWLKGYSFTNYSAAHVGLLTPAQHLLFYKAGPSRYCLREWFVDFLKTEVGQFEYDWFHKDALSTIDSTMCIFFRQKKGALTVRKKLHYLLDGQRFL